VKKIIVGLGNPGKQYMHTPHNIGFAVIDELAGRFAMNLRRSFRFRASLASGNMEGVQVTLAKPATFMNMSGTVVAALVRHKCLTPEEDLIVISDDANLPAGQLRIRPKGSSGGHKGLQSIIHELGHDGFARLRLGIGQAGGASLTEHVLTPFPPAVRVKIENMIAKAADAVAFWLKHGMEATMNMFNKPTEEDIL